jgi:hypothetical protein
MVGMSDRYESRCCQKLKIPQFPQTPCSFCTQLGRGTSSQEQPPTARTTMRWGRVTVLALVAVLGHVAALDNGAASTPPLGWCSWQRYRCAIACNDSTSINCFNEVRTQVSTSHNIVLGIVVGVRVLCLGASVCHPCECDSVYANAQKRIIVCPTALSAGHRGHSQQPHRTSCAQTSDCGSNRSFLATFHHNNKQHWPAANSTG